MKNRLINGFLFRLDQNNHTASILKSYNSCKILQIPRSVFYESQEYIIIKIDENVFNSWNPKAIVFSNDSELQIISKNAFISSGVQDLYLPASVKTEEGWNNSSGSSLNIKISPNNKYISYVNDCFLISYNYQPDSSNAIRTQKINGNLLTYVRKNIEFAEIPSNIAKIGDFAFKKCSILKNVTFNSSNTDVLLEEIGNESFYNCKSLENIATIPSSVKKIGKRAFAFCSKLKKLQFAEDSSLTTISSEAFMHSSICELTIPSKVEFLEEGWCNQTSELSKIIIAKDSKRFHYLNDQFLLKKCNINENDSYLLLFASRAIEEAIIPPNIRQISKFAFNHCGKLKSLTLPKSSLLEEIGESAFSECLLLEKIICFPSSVKIIRRSAFSGCSHLKSIEFPVDSKLKIIEQDAFKQALIEELHLPESIEYLEEGWCNEMNLLVNLTIPSCNKKYIYIDNKFLVDREKKEIIFFASRDIKTAIIPPTIKRIGNFAFANCKQMESLEFVEGSSVVLEEIGKYAFENCSNLKSFPCFPPSIKRIDNYAFTQCNKLSSICFSSDEESSNLEEIADGAFFRCWNLKTIVNIPTTVKRIGEKAFSHSQYLQSVSFQVSTNSESSLIEICDYAFNYSRNLQTVTGIPTSIQRIGNCAFENCVNLKEVTFQNCKLSSSSIPNSSYFLEEIGNNAFAYCKKLQSNLIISSSFKRIGRMAFAYCAGLNALEITEDSSLQFISSDAFFYSSIIQLTIPSKVEHLEENWCSDTLLLNKINISENNKYFHLYNKQFILKQNDSNSCHLLFAIRDIKEAIIPSNVTEIGNCAFASCSKMTHLDFQHSSQIINNIGSSAFSNCLSLESVTIPSNRIKKIGNFAFFKCSNLKRLIFESSESADSPDMLNEIGEDAFDFCEGLEYISPFPATVKTVGKECFRPLKKIVIVEFLGDEISIGDLCFSGCSKLIIASFPNAKKASFGYRSFYEVSNNFSIFINPRCNAKFTFKK